MPFKFDPQVIPEGHIFHGKYFHLTYAAWLEDQIILRMVAMVTSVPLDGYSIVWEDTTYKEGNITLHRPQAYPCRSDVQVAYQAQGAPLLRCASR